MTKTSESQAVVLYRNALNFLASERRTARQIDVAYRMLARRQDRIEAGIIDWLANPFLRTALGILRKFQDNYKIQQALRLLEEAGTEAEAQAKEAAKKAKAKKKGR